MISVHTERTKSRAGTTISPTGRNLRKRNKAGFTLIELILITVILAVIVSISTPLFRNTFASLRMRDASFNLSKLINYVQEKSVMEGVPYKLILDAERKSYHFLKSDDADGGKYKRLKEKMGRSFRFPEDITVTSSKKEIIFYPDGHSEKCTVTLSGKGGSVTMGITGRLGLVDISSGS